MKYYVLAFSKTEAKEILLAFESDYREAFDFAGRVDGILFGIDSAGTPSLWPDPDPVRFQTMEEVLES